MSNTTQPAKIAVFCGAKSGAEGDAGPPVQAAKALAQQFHKYGAHLVYGGGTHGVMGNLAKELVKLSGPDSVLGIIPEPLLSVEREKTINETTHGKTIVVKSMHQRKIMFKDAVVAGGPGSGFVALSGGWGTLEELFEVITWNQLNIHDKPIVIFNVDSIFDDLKPMVEKIVEKGFITTSNKSIPSWAETAEEVFEKIRTYELSPDRLNLAWKDGQE